MEWDKGQDEVSLNRSKADGDAEAKSAGGEKEGLWQGGGLCQVPTARNLSSWISVQVSPPPK